MPYAAPVFIYRVIAETALASGAAYEKFKQMVAAQGGDVRYIENPALFPETALAVEVCAPQTGYIAKMNAENIGKTAALLGAGREKIEDSIDMSAGIVLHAKTGDFVKEGAPLATLYTNRETVKSVSCEQFLNAVSFSDTPPQKRALIMGEVT